MVLGCTGDLEVDILWSGLPAEQVAQEGAFRLSRAVSWRLHALSPGPSPPSSSFYSSRVCSPAAALLDACYWAFVSLNVVCGC